MTGNVSSGNLTNYYLFLTQFSNVSQQMDTNGDRIVTKNEFQNFFVQNWNGTSATAEGALEMDLVNRLFQEFNTVGGYGFVNNSSNFRNANVLYGSEINGMNETIQQYAVLNSYRDRLNAIPGISDFPQVISLTLAQLGALVAQNVNNPDPDTPIETLLEYNFVNFTNSSIQAIVPGACLATIADRPELNGLNYNYQDDSTLNSIVTNFVNSAVQSSSGEIISIPDIQQSISNIIDAYLSTALLGEGVDDISILTDNGYDNTQINDLQKSVLEKTIKDRILNLAGSDYQNYKSQFDNAITNLLNQIIDDNMEDYDGDFSSLLEQAGAVEIPQSLQDRIYKDKLVAELLDLEDNLNNHNSLDYLLFKALIDAGYENEEISKITKNLMSKGFNNQVIAALEAEFENGNIDMRDNNAIIEFYVKYIKENIDEILKEIAEPVNPNTGNQDYKVPINNNATNKVPFDKEPVSPVNPNIYNLPIFNDKDVTQRNNFEFFDVEVNTGSDPLINTGKKPRPNIFDFDLVNTGKVPREGNGIDLVNGGKKPRSAQGQNSNLTSDSTTVENLKNEILEIYETQIQKGGAFKEVVVKEVGSETKYVEYLNAMDEAKLQKTLISVREKIEVVEQKEQRKASNEALNKTLEKMKLEEQEAKNTKRLNLEM